MAGDPCADIEIPDVSALIRSARDRVTELCALPSDWDGPGGSPISAESAKNAVRLVWHVTCPECLNPSLSPTSGGNILVDWTWGPDHVEVEVFADGRLEVLVRLPEEQWEGVLKIDDHGHLGWLAYRVTGVGLDRFDVSDASA